MQGIIWLWKHRHCWEQLKYLYEHRYSLKVILSKVSLHPDVPEKVESILECLREFDRVPLTGHIPPRGKLEPQHERFSIRLPTNTKEPNPFLEKESN